MHGVWKFNNITPSHPSHAVDTYCTRPSMAVGWCLHRRLRRKRRKKKSTDFPSMAVCCATLFSPTKGKSTWGVEILQYNPILVDGRPLLPSLPSHRTLFADTFFAAFPSYALSADTLRESKLLPPFTRVQPSAGGRPRYRRRAIGDTYSVPSRLGPSVDGRRRMSGSPVKKENQKN